MGKNDEKGCGPQWGWARKRVGPPWMRGGPPWTKGSPFGGLGQRGPRMFAQGDLRLLLLALIADTPSHGYDLIRTIEARFGGTYAPSPGTIYPTLAFLEEQGLITVQPDDNSRKTFAATPEGRTFLAGNAEDVQALMRRIEIMAGSGDSEPMPAAVLHAVGTLRNAIFSKFGNWSRDEELRVRTILETAAHDIMNGAPAGKD